MSLIRQMGLLLVGVVVILSLTLVCFGLPLGPSLSRIAAGAFGGEIGWSRTLVFMTPLLLTGCGMVVAWQAGMYNIGGEGQYIFGGLGAASLALLVSHWSPWIASPVLLAGSILGGAILGWFAGWLHVRRGVQVVISTILLNFIAIQVLQLLVQGPLKDPSSAAPQTASLPEGLMLHQFSRRTDLHIGVILAVVVAIGLAVVMKRSVFGFRLRLVGANPRVARANLISSETQQLRAMALSGGLCGLAGGIQFMGITGVLDSGFPQNWGFLSIPVALLGGLDPIGAIVSSLLFGALFAGTQSLSREVQGGDMLIFVVQGVAVLAFVWIRSVLERRQPKGAVQDD